MIWNMFLKLLLHGMEEGQARLIIVNTGALAAQRLLGRRLNYAGGNCMTMLRWALAQRYFFTVTFLVHCNVNTAHDFQKLKINIKNATHWTRIIFCQLDAPTVTPCPCIFSLYTFASSAAASNTEGCGYKKRCFFVLWALNKLANHNL